MQIVGLVMVLQDEEGAMVVQLPWLSALHEATRSVREDRVQAYSRPKSSPIRSLMLLQCSSSRFIFSLSSLILCYSSTFALSCSSTSTMVA